MDEERTSGLALIIGTVVALPVALLLVVLLLGILIVGASFPADSALTSASGQSGNTDLAVPDVVMLPPLAERGLPDAADFTWAAVADGFDNPVFITHAGDGTKRLFVVEQTGLIWIIANDEVLPTPFLDVSRLLSPDVFRGGYSERGLLGLAFHPNYAENGTFFIHHTDVNGDTNVARYRVSRDNPNRADAESRALVLFVDQPYADHNGGMIAFGPDGYLYIGMGDGGSPDDPHEYGQNTTVLLGKLLRIDVNADTYTVPQTNPFVGQDDYAPEIWAYGLRNPWRFSFDRLTGDLYIGDVGQWDWEEVNYQPADFAGGANYGWSAYQGMHEYLGRQAVSEVTMPFTEYAHSEGCSVTGGYVYRGTALPELVGAYFFGDYCSGRIWVSYPDGAGAWQTALYFEDAFVISSFGEDEDGELYMVDYKGVIYRLQRRA